MHREKSSFESRRIYHTHNTKIPKQNHDKKTVNVKVYQNTKIDAQIHTTDKN